MGSVVGAGGVWRRVGRGGAGGGGGGARQGGGGGGGRVDLTARLAAVIHDVALRESSRTARATGGAKAGMYRGSNGKEAEVQGVVSEGWGLPQGDRSNASDGSDSSKGNRCTAVPPADARWQAGRATGCRWHEGAGHQLHSLDPCGGHHDATAPAVHRRGAASQQPDSLGGGSCGFDVADLPGGFRCSPLADEEASEGRRRGAWLEFEGRSPSGGWMPIPAFAHASTATDDSHRGGDSQCNGCEGEEKARSGDIDSTRPLVTQPVPVHWSSSHHSVHAGRRVQRRVACRSCGSPRCGCCRPAVEVVVQGADLGALGRAAAAAAAGVAERAMADETFPLAPSLGARPAGVVGVSSGCSCSDHSNQSNDSNNKNCRSNQTTRSLIERAACLADGNAWQLVGDFGAVLATACGTQQRLGAEAAPAVPSKVPSEGEALHQRAAAAAAAAAAASTALVTRSCMQRMSAACSGLPARPPLFAVISGREGREREGPVAMRVGRQPASRGGDAGREAIMGGGGQTVDGNRAVRMRSILFSLATAHSTGDVVSSSQYKPCRWRMGQPKLSSASPVSFLDAPEVLELMAVAHHSVSATPCPPRP